MRPFTEVDWYGWAGAEPWANGDQPLIGNGPKVIDWEDQTLIVADRNGMEIYNEDASEWAFLHQEMTQDMADLIGTSLHAMGEVTKEDLTSLGFRFV